MLLDFFHGNHLVRHSVNNVTTNFGTSIVLRTRVHLEMFLMFARLSIGGGSYLAGDLPMLIAEKWVRRKHR
jgi:hypothetical protein